MHTGVRGARPGLFPDRGRRAMGGRACGGGRRRRGSAAPAPPHPLRPAARAGNRFFTTLVFRPVFYQYRRKPRGYASVCVRYASPDAYLRPHENPWNTRDYRRRNRRYALYASVFRVTPFYGVFPYRARIPRIPAQAAPRNRRNQAEKRGRKGMHHVMHTPRIPDPADAYPPASARDA